MKPHPRSLLGTEQLTVDEIEAILKLARRMDPKRAPQLLRGKRVVLLFYEPSTRTRTSFEFAAKALGATTTLITNTSSSIEKGESLIDTGWTVTSLGADVIVMRHPNSGAPYLLSRFIPVPVINAGDGLHQHPVAGAARRPHHHQSQEDAQRTARRHRRRRLSQPRRPRQRTSALQVRRRSHLLWTARSRTRHLRHSCSRRHRLPRSRRRAARSRRRHVAAHPERAPRR